MIRNRFADRLVRDANRIEQLIGSASHGNDAARHDIQEIAHRMAGASGSFGFAGVGLRAAELEEAIAGDGVQLRSAAKGLMEALENLRNAR